MSSVRRTVLILLWITLLAAPAAPVSAQMIRKDGELVLHAFTLRNRPAAEAVQLVSTMLSQRGTVELQPATNTLVIRDTPAVLGQVIPALRRYDHPSRPLNLDIFIVRATRSTVSGAPSQSDLPEVLTRKLRALLPYENFDTQAQARLASREGEAVTFTLGGEYEVSFRLGAIVQGDEGLRVRMSDFRISRHQRRIGGSQMPPHLNVALEQTTNLVLARSEESNEALMVVFTLRQGKQQQRPAQPRK
jgi:hypothetical protein